MLRHNNSFSSLRKPLLWMLAAPTVFCLSIALERNQALWAQTPEVLEGVEIPTTLPAGTELNIESSESMRLVNEALQPRFAEQYDAAKVEVNYQDSGAAIQSLLDGNVDLAAIGRGLLDSEAAQGLKAVPLSRHKIAIIISPENPFNGSLTTEQFAQIFRGEITNWSQVGGPDAPIVLVDRPAASDTRQAFQSYPVFQNAPFEAAAGAISLDTDSTEAVVKELGPTAISYAIADQALENPNIKIVPMHDTLPDDPRYPFSQPLAYVYSQDTVTPEALAYLGYAVNPDNEAVIEAARAAAATEATPAAESETAAEPEPTAEGTVVEEESATTLEVEEEPVPAATSRTRGVPWWPWILALPLLGGLLWWLLRNRAPVAAAPIAAVPDRRIILTPRDCRNAYAYWELPESEVEALRRQNYSLALRLHDVTGIDNVDQTPPHSMKPFECDTVAVGDRHLPVELDDRDYLVELGYVGNDAQWHALARSAKVKVPACPSAVPQRAMGVGAAAAGAAGLAAATAAVARPSVVKESGRVILTPLNCKDAYAYWELPEGQISDLRLGNRALTARLYDITQRPDSLHSGPNSVQEFTCERSAQGDLHMPVAVDDRDYVVELGYTSTDGRWHSVAKSEPVRVPACPVPALSRHPSLDTPATASATAAAIGLRSGPVVETPGGSQTNGIQAKVADLTGTVGRGASDLADGASRLTGAALAGGAAVITGAGVAAHSLADGTKERLDAGAQTGIGVRSDLGAESRIIIVPRSHDRAYVYWEAAEAHKAALRQQGGKTMALRIHDATNLDIDYQPPHATQEYLCQVAAQDYHVPISTPDRDYVAELGYLTADGSWLRLIRSLHVRVPADS